MRSVLVSTASWMGFGSFYFPGKLSRLGEIFPRVLFSCTRCSVNPLSGCPVDPLAPGAWHLSGEAARWPQAAAGEPELGWPSWLCSGAWFRGQEEEQRRSPRCPICAKRPCIFSGRNGSQGWLGDDTMTAWRGVAPASGPHRPCSPELGDPRQRLTLSRPQCPHVQRGVSITHCPWGVRVGMGDMGPSQLSQVSA